LAGVEEEGEDDDSDTILNGEYILESSSGSGLFGQTSPSSTTDLTTEPTEPTATDESAGDAPPLPFIFPEDRRYSDPPPFISSSSGTVGGDVESTVSIKTLPFTPNANSRQDYQKFLRRFISTQVSFSSFLIPYSHSQMFSEYDRDIVGILRNVETVSNAQQLKNE
jgi:hypothetical protein